MDQRLKEVAEAGDTKGLYALIAQDCLILDKVDPVPFVDTPLHIAAREGNSRFSMEIANLKPSFARKLNQDGYSPVHLALGGGHELIVRGLVAMDNELVRLKGREGRTALHEAAIVGNIGLMRKFLSACPMAFEDLTVKQETALHLALKCNQLGAFNFLMKWLKLHNREEVLRHRDDEGNTILHLGVACTDHDEVVKLLLGKQYVGWVEVNAENSLHLTALDVVERAEESHNRLIRKALYRAGALKARDNITTGDSTGTKRKKKTLNILPESLRYFRYRKGRDSPSDVRNALLVVAVLIATATYDAGVSPRPYSEQPTQEARPSPRPGDVRHYSEQPTQGAGLSPSPGDLRYYSEQPTQYAGPSPSPAEQSTPAVGLSPRYVYTTVNSMMFNSLGFYSSVFMMVILTMGFPLQRVLLISLMSMFFNFLNSLLHNSDGITITSTCFIGIGIGALILACGYIAIRFLRWPFRFVHKCRKSSMEDDDIEDRP